MKNAKTRVAIAGIALLTAAMAVSQAGCRNALEPRGAGGAETGSLSLTVGQGRARTIMPEISGANDFDAFDLALERENHPADNRSAQNWDGGPVENLRPGAWRLTVTAFLRGPNGDLAAAATSGQIPFAVSAGEATNLNVVNLAPIPGGRGWFGWDLSFPPSVSSAGMTVTDLGGGPETSFCVYSGVPGGVEFASGQYRASLVLSHGGGCVTITRILRVFSGATSRWGETFTEGDLARQTFLDYFLGLWDGASWGDLSWVEIGHFDVLRESAGVEGVTAENLGEVLFRFNAIERLPAHPGYQTAGDLARLVDAALVGVAGEDAGFALAGTGVGGNFLNRTSAQGAVSGLPRNGTGIAGFDWADGGAGVTVRVGPYAVPIGFNGNVPVTLAEQLAWLRNNARDGGGYLVEIIADEDISPAAAGLPYGRIDLAVTLVGTGLGAEPSNVRLSENGSLFTVDSGVTLVLDNNVTLMGRGSNATPQTANNNNHLVRVNGGGTLRMNTGSTITGNRNATGTGATGGGGVRVNGGGTFDMHGGTISHNYGGTGGGGVSIAADASFVMHDGVISDNTTTSGSAGVAIHDGRFTMYGGDIFRNIAGTNGGGVGVSGNVGTFDMHSGRIIYNHATSGSSGGVGVFNGTFTMRDGLIFGNQAARTGGGVGVSGVGRFHISGGTIYGDGLPGTRRNLSLSGEFGASLANYATAQRGTFNNGTFTPLGSLSTTNSTIRAVNGFLFARVQSGTFRMGTPRTADGQQPGGTLFDEWPDRLVTISSGFYMGRFPVTQGEWYYVMRPHLNPNDVNPSYFTGARVAAGIDWRNLPVEQVSWYDAIEFTYRMSRLAGLEPWGRINGIGADRTVTWNWYANGYRLPTEAEWEFTARAGSTGLWSFSGGRYVAYRYAWYGINSQGRTHEVGGRRPNAWGLYDIHGNVWEWVYDWYGPYPSEPQRDPRGVPDGIYRVLRGGAWNSTPVYPNLMRPAIRGWHLPTRIGYNYGFRLVRPVNE